MKKVFTILFLLAIAIVAIPQANAKSGILGHEVPFPLGTELPFPWDTIEGTWQTSTEDGSGYFSFKVLQNDCVTGRKFLKVREIDIDSDSVLSQGPGYASADQRIVRAVMKGPGYAYILIVRVYKNTRPDLTKAKVATVLTIRPLGTTSIPESHFILEKVSDLHW